MHPQQMSPRTSSKKIETVLLRRYTAANTANITSVFIQLYSYHLGMCGRDFLKILVQFRFFNKTWIRFRMSLVQFKKCGSVRILWLFATHVIDE